MQNDLTLRVLRPANLQEFEREYRYAIEVMYKVSHYTELYNIYHGAYYKERLIYWKEKQKQLLQKAIVPIKK